MRALTDVGPAADQDAIAAVAVINDISITVTERGGPCLVIGTIGFTDTDALATVTTGRILQEGAPVGMATMDRESAAVDNTDLTMVLLAFVENVAVGQTFTMDITPAGTGVDVKANNCNVLVVGLGQLGAESANFVSP